MRLNLSTHGEFIPSWMGNKELSESDQIKVEYKRITGNLSSRMIRIYQDGTSIFDNEQILKNCEIKISNLIDHYGKKLETASDILEAVGTQGLVTEIAMHILSDSKIELKIEKKNKDSVTLGK